MSKYRIKKVTNEDHTRYFPEVKFLFWWYNPFKYEPYRDGGFGTLEGAQEKLRGYFKYPVVEYIDFDPSRDCK
jgi:hypothetical protein